LSTLVATPLSIDTSRPEVMRAAVAAGTTMINDVRALTEPGALTSAAELAVPVCLVHMQGTPATMQHNPHYTDVTTEVRDFLAQRLQACRDAGIPDHDLIVDPGFGFGFGKKLQHNLTLLAHLNTLRTLQCPVLVGLSRKGMLGHLTARPMQDRLAGSLTAAVLAVQRGAGIVRVHDVAATRDALAVLRALTDKENR
jgi:dihydropteroate synthase